MRSPELQPHRPSIGVGGIGLLLACAAWLSGCGDGSGGVALDPLAATRVAVDVEPAGVHCASGGARVLAGNDLDNDGLLSAAEVTSIQYVCNGVGGLAAAGGATGAIGATGATGATGASGLSALVRVLVEAPGPRRAGRASTSASTSIATACSRPAK